MALTWCGIHTVVVTGAAGSLGRKVTADWVRKWLRSARERFAELLMAEVAASLENASAETIVEELIDLELFQYCKIAIDRRQNREENDA